MRKDSATSKIADLIKISICDENTEYGIIVSNFVIDLENGDSEGDYMILKKNILNLPEGEYNMQIKHYKRKKKEEN